MKKLFIMFIVITVVFAQVTNLTVLSNEELQSTEESASIFEENIPEHFNQGDKADRYIIKYMNSDAKQGAETAIQNALSKGKTRNAFEAQQLESKINQLNGYEKEKLEYIVSARQVALEKSDLSKYEKFSKSLNTIDHLTEVVILDEAINSKDFISSLKTDMGNSIEYIQEDIQVNLSARSVQFDEIIETKVKGFSGETKIVAVIDTGVDITHPALELRVVGGYDFVNDSNNPYSLELGEEQNHGTHIAGIIASTAENIQIMPLKVFENGTAYTSDIITAIEYAESNGASIVNCSWGATGNNPALREIIENSSMFFVCAAGNSRMDLSQTPIYPASFNLANTISVASVNQDLGLSYFSNYGVVDIAAKGRDINSTVSGGNYAMMNGTSMAAAYVSAAAALSSETNLKSALMTSADKLSCLDGKVETGNYLNIDNLLDGIQGQVLTVYPEDDFDKWIENTPEDSWMLFNSSPTVQIETGANHTVVLKANGTVFAWGSNASGQLGIGSNDDQFIPTQVVGISDVVAIAAGGKHTLALTNNGDVFSWGENEDGQLGNGSYVSRNTPTPNPVFNEAKAIDAGWHFTAVIKENGDVYTWGNNQRGQIGDDSNTHRNTPTLNPIFSDAKAIAAAWHHMAALKENGDVYTWGANDRGQLGDGLNTHRNTPTPNPVLSDIKSISVGHEHTIALKENGDVHTWGYNWHGQLGNGENRHTDRRTPTTTPVLSGAKAISGGFYHTVALTENGDVHAWGKNENGQLGNGSVADRSTAGENPVISEAAAISAGGDHTAMMNIYGEIYTWGDNAFGQLGIAAFNNRYTAPQLITDFKVYDEYGSDFTSAALISINQEVYGVIGNSSQNNYYKFIGNLGSYFTFECADGITIVVFDEQHLQISPINFIGKAYYEMDDTATYYVRITANSPFAYSLKVEIPDLVFNLKPFKIGVDSPALITSLQNGFVLGDIEVINNTEEVVNIVLLMMLKKNPDSSLESIITIPKIIAAGATESFNGGLNISDYQNYMIEIMALDSLANMNLLYSFILR